MSPFRRRRVVIFCLVALVAGAAAAVIRIKVTDRATLVEHRRVPYFSLLADDADLAAITEEILKDRALLTSRFAVDQSALTAAVKKGRSDVVSMLLANGADPDGVDARDCPLLDAVIRGDARITKILLKAGADRNKKCGPSENMTVADHAEVSGSAEIRQIFSQ